MDLQFTAILEESNNKLWGGHFQVPIVIARSFEIAQGGNTRRVVCTLNDTIEYQCAILPYGEGRFVITVNKKIQKQFYPINYNMGTNNINMENNIIITGPNAYYNRLVINQQ